MDAGFSRNVCSEVMSLELDLNNKSLSLAMDIAASAKIDICDSDIINDLWFTDDTVVVIQCGLKKFRLPRCILTSQSRILDQSIAGHTHSSGVLHLHLLDPPDHTEYFLRAIYHSKYFEPPPTRAVLEQIIGILSLSHKYKVAYLQRRALLHLSTGYPWTLDMWKRRGENSTFLPVTDYSVPYATVNIPKTLSVLQLLSRVGAFWLLPSAFYECCRYSIKDIMEHPAWKDPGLDEGLKSVIIMGQMRHVEASHQVVRFLQKPSESECPKPSICLNIRLVCVDQISSWSKQNPFGFWDEGDWQLVDEMCVFCLKAAKSRHEKACEDLWQDLPELYELPPWDTLMDMMQS